MSLPKPPEDLKPALLRTVVPYLTAFIVASLAKNGIEWDPADVSVLVVGAGGAAWYTLVRFLEVTKPKAGFLIGSAKTPTYEKS